MNVAHLWIVSIPPARVQGDRGSAAKRWWSITGITTWRQIFASWALLSPHKLIRLRLGKLKIISDDHGLVIFRLLIPPLTHGVFFPARRAGRSVPGPHRGSPRGRRLLPSPGGKPGRGRTGAGGLYRVPVPRVAVSGQWRQVREDSLCWKRWAPHMNAPIQNQGRDC